MIGGMRKFAKSKWALVLLFIPLVIGLAMFLPDNFNGSGLPQSTLSRIGGREIRLSDVERETQDALEQIRREEGRVISTADAAREGRVTNVIQGLEFRNLLLAYGDKVGIQASAESLKPYLERNKLLVNEFGKISLDTLRYQAQQRRQSPREFENYIRDYLTLDYILRAMAAALKTPDVLSQPWINFLGESRTLTFARVTENTVPKPAEPTDAELQAWYDTHKQSFLQPERRRISLLTYSPDDFLDRVEMTEEQVKAEYEMRIKDYSTPETRTVVEFASLDRNTVQSFVDLAVQGVPVEEALARVPGIARNEMTVKPADVADADYSRFLFSMPLDKVHGVPLQVQAGEPFKTVMVTNITPGVPTPYEEIAAKVRRDASWEDAVRLFEDSSEPFRDAAGGQPLEDIGKQFGLPVISLAPVDDRARTLQGDQAQLLTRNVDAFRQLATMSAGEMTNVFEGDNERSIFRLDEIVPPYTQPFDEVKERVKATMLAEKLAQGRAEAAEAMVAAVKAGTAFDKAAADAKLTTMPTVTLIRGGTQQMDPALITGGFTMQDGEVGVVRDGQGNPWVVRVDKVVPVTPEIAAVLRAQLGQQVSQSLQQDIEEVFVRGLQEEVDYKRDDAAIQRYIQGLIGDSATQ